MPPPSQSPWPEQPFGQAGRVQSGPAHPFWQTHRPCSQTPRSEHCCGQVSCSHAAPRQPEEQRHLPDRHCPWPSVAWQPSDAPSGICPGHVSMTQSGASHPMSHRQIPNRHVAWPEQVISSHESTEQSADIHPGWQRHAPDEALNTPLPEQGDGFIIFPCSCGVTLYESNACSKRSNMPNPQQRPCLPWVMEDYVLCYPAPPSTSHAMRGAWTALFAIVASLSTPSMVLATAAGCAATASYPDGTTVERECIVEGEGGRRKQRARSSDSDEFSWIKDTRWLWNNWREVIFRADGSFLAPAENCERPGNPKCRWSSRDDQLLVECAQTQCPNWHMCTRSHATVRHRTPYLIMQVWQCGLAHADRLSRPADPHWLSRL